MSTTLEAPPSPSPSPQRRRLFGRRVPAASSLEEAERNAILTRLRSFSLQFWFDKPPALSASACAVRGWSCVAKDTLQCQGCSRRLVVRLSDRLEDAAKKRISDEFRSQLQQRHQPFCSYLNSASATCLLLSLDPDEVRDAFGRRLSCFTAWDTPLQQYSRFVVPPEAACLPVHTALSVCGWRRHARRALACGICQRVVELRPSVAKRVRREGEEASPTAEGRPKRPRPGSVFEIGFTARPCSEFGVGRDMFGRWSSTAVAVAEKEGLIDAEAASELRGGKVFNALAEHRFFCPWVSPELPNGKPGWETCLQLVQRDLAWDCQGEEAETGAIALNRPLTADRVGLQTIQSVRRLLSRLS